jgi:exodeoxyribonuclease VII small subunit
MTDTAPGAGPASTPAGTPPDGEIGYADALAELEEILDELDGDEVDVDVLGARVRRAAELLRLCRARIAGARFEVEQVVGELEAEAEAATAAAGVHTASDDLAEDEDDEDEGDEDADPDDDEDRVG